MKPVYLDYNATTPIDSEVTEYMIPVLRENFGNPSSNHWYGTESRKIVEKARKQLANLLNCEPYEILFTSGGTESNNLAINGIAREIRHKGNHIITSQIEHPAVLEVCKNLEKEGFEISYLPCDPQGMIEPEIVKNNIKNSTILISIMHANNEIGSIQNIDEIAKIAHEKNIIIHTDAAQSVGKIGINLQKMKVDLLSVAGHKFYGPKGVGALFIRNGIRLKKIMEGANHEQNIRPGTENVPEIAGLGKAAEIALRDLEQNTIKMKATRDQLWELIHLAIPSASRNGHSEKVLPNTLNISFPGIDATTLLSALTGVAASAGAACHADEISLSHVLQALNLPIETAMGTIRLSTGKYSTKEEINQAAEQIIKEVRNLDPNNQNNSKQSLKKESIKLTQFTHGLGCACKISPKILDEILKNMPVALDPNALVGADKSDDAAVYKIDDEKAIVQSVDFFTPVIDDPYDFGAIAAANALSDIYAMGARPLFGLNIVAFPVNRLPLSVLSNILEGAASVAKEAGISILGGHTIEDNEPKFGMVVTGLVHPEKILRNGGAKKDDVLILTKAIGTGILSTALKKELISEETKMLLFETMRKLNKTAAECMQAYSISACTDVTGFGLAGHLHEMCKSSGLTANIIFNNIPLLPEIKNLVAQDIIPGGTQNNIGFLKNQVLVEPPVSNIENIIFHDAQTSGGLLIALPEKEAQKLLQKLIDNGLKDSAIIGKFEEKTKYSIKLQ
jgi:cysteine desulfurase